MRQLIKNSIGISATELLLIIIAIMKNKYLSVAIGSEGFGLFGLLTSFFGTFSVLSGTWVGAITTTYIAGQDEKGDIEKKNKIFTFAFFLTLILGVIISIILIVSKSYFLTHFLSNNILEIYYLIFCAAFIGMNLQPIFMSILQGLLRVEIVVKSRIIISVIDFMLLIGLIFLFNLLGFFIGYVLSALLSSGLLYYYLSAKCGIRFTTFHLRESVIKGMITFGGISFFLGLISAGSIYFQRFIIMKKLGIHYVGLLMAGLAIMNYLGILSRGSSFHYLPSISKEMDNNSYINHLNNYLLFSLLTTIPFCVCAITFGKIGLEIFFSKEFLPLSDYLIWFILSQFLAFILGPLQITVLGMVKYKLHSIACIVMQSTFVIIPFFFIDEFGFITIPLGMLLSQVFGFFIYFLYLRKVIEFRFTKRLIYLLFYSLIVFAVTFALKHTPFISQLLLVSITLSGLILFVTKEERAKVIAMALSKVKKGSK